MTSPPDRGCPKGRPIHTPHIEQASSLMLTASRRIHVEDPIASLGIESGTLVGRLVHAVVASLSYRRWIGIARHCISRSRNFRHGSEAHSKREEKESHG